MSPVLGTGGAVKRCKLEAGNSHDSQEIQTQFSGIDFLTRKGQQSASPITTSSQLETPVVWTESVQMILLLVGAIVITVVGYLKIGGWTELAQTRAAHPHPLASVPEGKVT